MSLSGTYPVAPEVRSFNYVWDTNLLEPVPETQPGGGAGGTVDQGTGGLSPWLVTASSWPLPTGAATEATLTSIDGKLTNPLPVSGTFTLDSPGTSRTATGTLGSPTDTVTISCQGCGTVGFEIDSGLNGDVRTEATKDGSTWQAVDVFDSTGTIGTPNFGTFPYRGQFLRAAEYTQCRLRVTNYTSGSSAVRLAASGGSDSFTYVLFPSIPDVTGTVTARQGTPASTANRWPVQITDGTDLALVTAAGEVNVIATAQPGVDIGVVTANAGTNLNTSLLALESGGNLATVATNTDPLITAQGDDATGVLGPMVQGVTSDTAISFDSNAIVPFSLTTDGRLRVITLDESNNFTSWGSVFDYGDPGVGVEAYPLSAW